MNYKDLLKEIKDNNTGSLYLIYGEEFLLSVMMMENLKKSLIDPTYEQLNFTKIEDKNLTVDQLINYCETLPFISGKRMVVVVNFSMLTATGKSNDKDVEDLVHYLGRLNESTCLVFLNRTLDKKKKLYKEVSRKGRLVECAKLDRTDLIKWVKKRFRMSDKLIDDGTIGQFIDALDYLNRESKLNLLDVENEVEKIIAFSSGEKSIEFKDIEMIMPKSIESSIFKMVDFLGSKRLKDSLLILNSLFENGEPGIRILQMIVRQFRMMYQCKLLRDKGYSSDNIAVQTGFKPFMVNNVLRQGKNFSYEKLRDAFQRCAEIDVLFKSSRADQKMLLENLLYRFR